jgi:hypothetical protein
VPTISASLLGADEYRYRLASVPKKLQAGLRKELKGLAENTIMPEMRRRSGVYSSRIPRSLSVSVRYGFSTAGVFIRQSARVAPHGPINEGGGRHPVFGNREVWVYQPARPFFYVSARGKTRELRDAGNRAIDAATSGL